MEKVCVFVFKCLEGDRKFEKIKLFGKKDKMNSYITEFLENKFSEGWSRDKNSDEYVFSNSERYAVVTIDKQVHY